MEEPEPLNPAELTVARTLLAGAERPVLYVGGGVGMANAEQQLRDFAATTGMPAVTTLKGIGAPTPTALFIWACSACTVPRPPTWRYSSAICWWW